MKSEWEGRVRNWRSNDPVSITGEKIVTYQFHFPPFILKIGFILLFFQNFRRFHSREIKLDVCFYSGEGGTTPVFRRRNGSVKGFWLFLLTFSAVTGISSPIWGNPLPYKLAGYFTSFKLFKRFLTLLFFLVYLCYSPMILQKLIFTLFFVWLCRLNRLWVQETVPIIDLGSEALQGINVLVFIFLLYHLFIWILLVEFVVNHTDFIITAEPYVSQKANSNYACTYAC